MPKRLIDRCQLDSIHEFRLAAEEGPRKATIKATPASVDSHCR